MKKYLALLLLPAVVCSADDDEINCEAAGNTLEINACIDREVNQAESELEKYFSAAMTLVESEPAAQEALNQSQQAWLTYRRAHCDAIYQQWIDGSIRGAMFGGCMLKLTKIRTHVIWEDYLTYMDSETPVLPEPEL